MKEITFAMSIVALVGAIVWGAIRFDDAGFANPFYDAAYAAEPAAPTPISDNCELDSTIGILEVYFCDSDFGPDYYVNSFGFVVLVN